MIEIAKHTVKKISLPIRLLDYLIAFCPELPTRNGAKKAIKKGLLTLNGEQVESSRYVQEGQEIILFQEEVKARVFELKLEVLFEDEYLAIVNKPAGLSTSGNYFRTLEHALPYNLMQSPLPDALVQAKPVHRLDNQTSGVIIVAKTKSARITLGQHFEQALIQKTYHAVIQGKEIGSGEISIPIQEKDAYSTYETIYTGSSKKFECLSLVKLSPKTGRTHQLRIHMAALNSPIVGDKLYTPLELLFKGKGLLLASTGIAFKHPVTNILLHVNVAIPNKFTAFLNRYTDHKISL